MISKNYIDCKITIWQRLHFSEDADMNKVVEILKMVPDTAANEICDDELGFQECETLYDTEDYITVEENQGNSTIEVYSDSNLPIWENSKKI